MLEFIPEHRTSQLILQPRGRQRQEVKTIFLSIKEIPMFKIQAQMMSFMWNHSGDRSAGRRDSKRPCSLMCPVSTWVNWSWCPRWQSVGWAGWHGLEPWAEAQPPYSQPCTWLKAWLRVNTQQTRAGLTPSRFLKPGSSHSSPPLTILSLSPTSLLAFVLFAEDAARRVPAWKPPSLHLLQPHVPPSGPQWLLLTLSSELKHHHSE